MKEISEISWLVDEPTYRADSALSYSTLAKYERSGFDSIPTLSDSISTPSLLYGSLVDTLITGSQEEFEQLYMPADMPELTDSILPIVKTLFENNKDDYTKNTLYNIPDDDIVYLADIYNYSKNWKPETRARVIREKGDTYYKLLFIAGNRTIVTTSMYEDALKAVEALHTSPATMWYFQEDDPFTSVKRYYQLKFKATLNGVDYRCMADMIAVSYDDKLVIPCDLKTSGKKEYDFFKSFKEWRYDIQSRLYWRIIRDNMDRDPYFKDFKLADYRFIVVNKNNLTPMVWEFPQTQVKGTLEYGKNKQIIMRDPEEIGQELNYYLTTNATVPRGISTLDMNNLDEWLNDL